jgi:hypothetical protein
LNSYTVAFGILGLGVVLAALMWSVPLIKRNRQVRRFRDALSHLDTVATGWSHALREDRPWHDTTALPEPQRRRQTRRERPDDGGAALV